MKNFRLSLWTCTALTILWISGCGTVNTTSDFRGNLLAADSRFSVGQVTNQSGVEVPEVNLTQLLKDALAKELEEMKMLATTDSNGLVIDATIVEYQEGSAFKRWLLPGWGATVVTTKCNINDSKGSLLGTVDAHRTVSAGGGYTIGAWKTIFRDVAKDIVTELKEKNIKKAAIQK